MDSTTLPSDTGDSSIGLIIGVIIGVVVVIIAVIVIVVVVLKCRKKKSKPESGRVSQLEAAASAVPFGGTRPGTDRTRTQAPPTQPQGTVGRPPLAPSNTAASARAGAAASALAGQYDNTGFSDTSASFARPPSSSGSTASPPAAGGVPARPGLVGQDNPAFYDTTRASVYYVDVHNSNAGTPAGQGQPTAGLASQRQPASGARGSQRGQGRQGQGQGSGVRSPPPPYTTTSATGARATTPGRPQIAQQGGNYYVNNPSEYVRPDAYINAGYVNEPHDRARPYAYPQAAGNRSNVQAPPSYTATPTPPHIAAITQAATRGPSTNNAVNAERRRNASGDDKIAGKTERRRNASGDSSTERRRHASGEGKARSKSRENTPNRTGAAAAAAQQPLPGTMYLNLEEQSRARQQHQQGMVTSSDDMVRRSPARTSSSRRKKAAKNAARARRAAARESKPGERYVSMPGGGSLSRATGHGHDVDLDSSIPLDDAKEMTRTPSLGKRGYPQKQTKAMESDGDSSFSDPDIDTVIPFDHPGGMIRKSSAKKFRAAGAHAAANDFNDLDAPIPFEDAGSAAADHDSELDVNVTLEA